MPTINFSVTQSIDTLAVNLSASEALVMNINNPLVGASYFGLETIPDSNGVYTSSSPKNTSGSFTLGTGIIGLVKDDYKMSAVVSPGDNVLTFSPAVAVTGSTLRTRGISSPPPSTGYDIDYQTILNYATSLGYTLPSLTQQIQQNQLMLDLKSSGAWAKLDTFAMFATDGSSDFALIDWKRLTLYTGVNSPTFTSNGGFTGNGISSYIDTNFNPATQGVNYTLNDAGRFFWVDNRIGANNWEGGISFGGNSSLNSNVTAHRINSSNTLSSAVDFAVDGFHAINRTSSTNVELFTGTTQFSRTQTSTVVQSSNATALRSQNFYNGSRWRFHALGSNLVAENTAFYNAINTYLETVFDSEYRSVLNYATSLGYTLPSFAQQVKQNKLMLELKSIGAWAKLDTFAMFATDGSSNFALIDWKRLTLYTGVNSPTFTSNQGFTGNGTSSYIDTNFNPATQGVNYQLNNASRYYMHFAGSNTNVDGTAASSSYNRILINSATTNQSINSGIALSGNFTYNASKGIKSIHRISSTDVTCYNDTTGSSFTTAATTSLTSTNQFILRRGINYSNNTVFGYALGASLISENTAFYNAINTYMTSL